MGLGKGGIFVMGKTKIKMTATRYYLEWPIGVLDVRKRYWEVVLIC